MLEDIIGTRLRKKAAKIQVSNSDLRRIWGIPNGTMMSRSRRLGLHQDGRFFQGYVPLDLVIQNLIAVEPKYAPDALQQIGRYVRRGVEASRRVDFFHAIERFSMNYPDATVTRQDLGEIFGVLPEYVFEGFLSDIEGSKRNHHVRAADVLGPLYTKYKREYAKSLMDYVEAREDREEILRDSQPDFIGMNRADLSAIIGKSYIAASAFLNGLPTIKRGKIAYFNAWDVYDRAKKSPQLRYSAPIMDWIGNQAEFDEMGIPITTEQKMLVSLSQIYGNSVCQFLPIYSELENSDRDSAKAVIDKLQGIEWPAEMRNSPNFGFVQDKAAGLFLERLTEKTRPMFQSGSFNPEIFSRFYDSTLQEVARVYFQ